MTIDVRLPISAGASLLAEGRFAEALAVLREGIADHSSPVSLLNLAIAEDHAGDRHHARQLMRQVAARMPNWDEPLLRLAESLRAAGETAAAEEAYRHVLDTNPRRAEALIALSGLLLLRQQPAEALILSQRACDIDPDNHEAWNAIGLAHGAQAAHHLASPAFANAQRLAPDRLDYVLNGLDSATEHAEAELARLTGVAAAQPLNLPALIGRAVLLQRLGRRIEAIDVLEAVCIMAPDAVGPLRLLANALLRSPYANQAEKVLRRLCLLEPDNPNALNDHAVVLMRLHRHAEARVILRGILDRYGPQTSVLCNLANATVCLGEQEEAVALARQAIALDPQAVLPRRALCNTLPYRHGIAGEDMQAAMRDCSAVLPRTVLPPFTNTPDPERRLTVGLLSGTLRLHPVGWLTVAAFEALEPNQFGLVCLTQNVTLNDPITRRYRAAADEWIEVDNQSDVELAEAARFKGIDILIDLGGYGDAARMLACAHRLAPVQIKWVGTQAHSSGLAEMDWFITDRWETPEGFEPYYSERLLRLPDGYVCYSPPAHAPDVAVCPASRNGFITFGCFNNLAKITPRVVAVWAEILRRIPGSRLVLRTHQLSDPPTADRFRAAFAEHSVDPGRIEMHGSTGHRAFMAAFGEIDIALDPFPYSGGLTTCEALWMGVPTLTMPGEIFASRHSASHMSNAGFPDWVVVTEQDYINQAVARAADIPALAASRATMRQTVARSPLCDASRFGRGLGAALRTAWRAWCEQQTGAAASNPPPRA